MHGHGSFCWYECATRDAETAKAFYTELFGWEAEDRPMPDGIGGAYTILRRDGQDVAGLYGMHGPVFEGVAPHWGTYVWVDDVDAAAVKARDLGGEVLWPPEDVPNVGRMAALRDPQGSVIQLFKGAEHGGCRLTDGSPGSFCWNELMTPDTDGARAFYTALIGWTATEQEMGPGRTYTVFHAGETRAGGMMAMRGPQFDGVPPNWLNYVGVEDVTPTAAKAVELGGTVIVPPSDLPGIGRFTVLHDPTGAVIAALSRPLDRAP